jgi:hypothetical protein
MRDSAADEEGFPLIMRAFSRMVGARSLAVRAFPGLTRAFPGLTRALPRIMGA